MKSGLFFKVRGLLFVLAGVVIVSLFLNLFWISFIKSPTAYLEIYIEGQRRVFEGDTTPNMTFLDALIASSLAGNITFRYKLDPLKNVTEITALDGHDGEDPEGILLYLNSGPIETSQIHSIMIRPGDVMTVRLN